MILSVEGQCSTRLSAGSTSGTSSRLQNSELTSIFDTFFFN
jgi:hypothetical protein